MELRFACFYLTRQLEWILRKFQLAEVVLVVLKPHVFNLTRQLVSKPPECSTLAATDLPLIFVCTRWNVGQVEHFSPLSQTADQIIIRRPRSSVPVDRHHRRPPPPSTATPVDCHPRRLSMLLSAATVDCHRRHTSSPRRAVVYIAALPSASAFIIVACHRDGVKS